MRIELISAETLAVHATKFSGLLRDAVAHGASIGFTAPLAAEEVTDYWRKVGAEVAAGHRILLAAWDGNDPVVLGSAQLALEPRANGRHRAEVQKVMVLAEQRGRGIGQALMARVEAEALARGRRLLFLDTSTGKSGAEKFYGRLGYTFAGGIPGYAADPDGRLAANAIFYKQLI